MQTRIIRARTASEIRAACEEAARLIRQGDVVSFPTDTFYALGANALDEEAIAQVFRLKNRETNKPILILVQDAEEAERWAAEIQPVARVLMRRFWPGPLTLVLRASPSLPQVLTGGKGTVGIRVPKHSLTRELARKAQVPITGTSANPSGSSAPCSSAEVVRYFEGKIPLVLDGGESERESGSTIVSVLHPEPRLLREGEIPWREILHALKAPST